MVHGELFVTIILILKLRQLCVECWAILGELLFEVNKYTFRGSKSCQFYFRLSFCWTSTLPQADFLQSRPHFGRFSRP